LLCNDYCLLALMELGSGTAKLQRVRNHPVNCCEVRDREDRHIEDGHRVCSAQLTCYRWQAQMSNRVGADKGRFTLE
jgi:hypothetical protein